jgi:hypothetical protein
MILRLLDPKDDRTSVDDYKPKYLQYTMTLLHDQDVYHLMTDPTIIM